MNLSLLALDIVQRVPAMAQDSQENNIGLVISLIRQEQQRRPVKVKELLTQEQKMELTFLLDSLERELSDESRRSMAWPNFPRNNDRMRDLQKWTSILRSLLS